MSDRWSIYIDIEGFGALWEGGDQIILSLGEMMRAIFRLGRLCYPDSPERLFAHQFGDSFLIVSDFHEESLERCATIAIAIMRHVASTGRFARAAISEGDFSDINGCYPKEVTECLTDAHRVSLQMGLMTIIPVMGTALIRAVKLQNDGPSGPLLTIHPSMKNRLGPSVPQKLISNYELVSIDWIRTQSDLLTTIQQKGSLATPSPKELESMLSAYCQKHPVKDEWRASVFDILGVPKTSTFQL